MNRFLTLVVMSLMSTLATSQSWNPFLNQGIISPAPMVPTEFDGKGSCDFNIGNTGSSDLPLVEGDELFVRISLMNGVPDADRPLEAMGGSWLHYFDWSYDPGSNVFTGKQNKILPGYTIGNINVKFRSVNNSTRYDASNGFEARIIPPQYLNNVNSTDDDLVSSYTFSRAYDFGDAPASYGSASAEIRLFKDEFGIYENFVFLGDTVDHETTYFSTTFADGDNNDNLNDEDGVVFPDVVQGTTIKIPVSVTVRGGFGFLNAWIDWNGDGDFDDAGEQIVVNQPLFASELIELQVDVPANAIVGNTFARFRFGSMAGPTGHAEYGEVEDYMINIQTAKPSVALVKTARIQDNEPKGIIDTNDNIIYSFAVINNGNVNLSNISIQDQMVSVLGGPLSGLRPGLSDNTSFSAIYNITAADIENGYVSNTAIVSALDHLGNVIEDISGTDIYNDNPTVTILEIPRGRVFGSVWEDMNGNGVFDNGEPVVANVEARLYSADGDLVSSISTNEEGIYEFIDVLPGDYYARIILPAGLEYTFPLKGQEGDISSFIDNSNGFGTTPLFSINESSLEFPMGVGVYKCVEIGSLVWYDANENSIRDAWENGLSNVPVYLYRMEDQDEWVLWDTKITGINPDDSQEEGFFSFCTPPGTYYARFALYTEAVEGVVPVNKDALGYIPLGTPEEHDNDNDMNRLGITDQFTVQSGQQVNSIGAGYYPKAMVSSMVWLDENQNGRKDANESGMQGIVIEAYNSNNEKVGEAVSGSDGQYQIDYLMAGNHYFRFIAPNGYAFTTPKIAEEEGSKVTNANGPGTTNQYELRSGMVKQDVYAGFILGALPVRWVDVSAKREGRDNLVKWVTADEEGVDKFLVYRSVDNGATYNVIAELAAKANNQARSHGYQTHDTDAAMGGIYYYYIESVDFDGLKLKSRVVSVKVQGAADANVYPNPARDLVNVAVSSDAKSTYRVDLFNADGRFVRNLIKDQDLDGREERSYQLDGVEAGIYLLKIKIGETELERKLIVIK